MPDPSLRLRIIAPAVIPGSFNGRDVIDFQPGGEYDFPDQGAGGLAEVFLREGWAEIVVEPVEMAVEEVSETDAASAVEVPSGRRKRGK